MDHCRSCDPALDDPLPVADATTGPEVEPPEGDDPAAVGERLASLDTESLQRLAATQPTIEQAKGMLMARYGIDADAAFALLSRWSSERHVKVRELSRRVVEQGSAPDPQPFGALRRLLEQDGPG